MVKSKSKGMASEEAAEEEEKKAQSASHAFVDIPSDRAERTIQAGAVAAIQAGAAAAASDPTIALAPAPVPAPRKRGRPRKIVPKVEESLPLESQQSKEIDSKKLKVESPSSSTRNGTSSKAQALSDVKLNTRTPRRQQGSRRKSEPRRAAD